MSSVMKAVAGVAGVVALVACAGVRPAQAKDYPGPYDSDGGRYYADEARDFLRMGYDAPLPGYGRDRGTNYYAPAPPAYYGGYYTPAGSLYSYGASPAAAYSYGAYAPSAADNLARVRVTVPADARVWFDGHATKATGADRRFESPALTPGREYGYEIKARWRDANGKEVTRTRHIDVSANANVTVDFTRD